MIRSIAKAVALASVIAVGSLANPAPAEAGRGGRAAAAGIIGFAAGAIVGSSMNRRHNGYDSHYYDDHYYDDRYYAPRRRVRHYYETYEYSYAPEPWTREWYAYCRSKFRSFDPRSGTYQPYQGPRRLCR